MSGSGHSPRDRRVLLLMLLLTGLVLALNVVSAVVPGMDAALATLPIVVLLLVVGTAVVLGRALRG